MRPQLPYSVIKLASLNGNLSGTITVTDSPTRTLWDGGATRWDKHVAVPNKPHFHGGTIWDQPKQTMWDGGATRWLDTAPGWDTLPGTSTRRWVIGKANPNIYNIRDAGGRPLLARILIQPPDPRTQPQLDKRTIMRTAVQMWHNDKQTMIDASATHTPARFTSIYQRCISWYIRTHT